MVQTEFSAALHQVSSERGLDPEVVLETVGEALLAAYHKDHPESVVGEVRVTIDPQTGEARVFSGEEDITPSGFGRIAAQTAKQVVLQRIKEEEKDALVKDYQARIGNIARGFIFRLEKGVVIMDLGKTQGIMPQREQVPGENYQINQQLQVLIAEIRDGMHGPEIIVSRARPEFVKELFSLEVPEIDSGTVKIERIAREPGRRTKIAASSTSENVDPVGSLVGQKGSRVQTVIRELGEEKIDIIAYSEDTDQFIANALSPAKTLNVKIDEAKKTAVVEVPEDQLSLAIGKEGQNVRLAAKLTGWRIDIRGPEGKPLGAKVSPREGVVDSELVALGISTRAINSLQEAGIATKADLEAKPEAELAEIKGIGPKALEEIKAALTKAPPEQTEPKVETTATVS